MSLHIVEVSSQGCWLTHLLSDKMTVCMSRTAGQPKKHRHHQHRAGPQFRVGGLKALSLYATALSSQCPSVLKTGVLLGHHMTKCLFVFLLFMLLQLSQFFSLRPPPPRGPTPPPRD